MSGGRKAFFKKENDRFQTRAKTRAPRSKQTSVANLKATVLERVCFVFAESSVGPKRFEPVTMC